MRVKHACRHTIHWQTDQRHMKCKAAQDKDNVSSFPLLMSHEHFLASSRRLYTLQIHVHYIWKLTQSIYGCIFGTSFWAWNGKFAPLTIMNNEDTDLDSMIITFNTAVTETASEILGKHRQKGREKKPGSLQKFLICATGGENSVYREIICRPATFQLCFPDFQPEKY